MSIFLRIKYNDEKHEIELTEKEFFVGRSSKNDLKIDDPKLSSVHCSFRIFKNRATVKDQDSSNGTTKDDVIVDEAFISVNQRVKLGSTIAYLIEDKMNHQELSLHLGSEHRQEMVIDLEQGIMEKSEIASQVLARNKQSKILANRKHLKRDEDEKFKVDKKNNKFVNPQNIIYDKKVDALKSRKNNKSLFQKLIDFLRGD
jgi:pSer/pThr/pTyr-binding forkhead associated (FHA) protein